MTSYASISYGANRRHYPTRILAMFAAMGVVSVLLPYLAYRNYLEARQRQ